MLMLGSGHLPPGYPRSGKGASRQGSVKNAGYVGHTYETGVEFELLEARRSRLGWARVGLHVGPIQDSGT